MITHVLVPLTCIWKVIGCCIKGTPDLSLLIESEIRNLDTGQPVLSLGTKGEIEFEVSRLVFFPISLS